MSQIDAPKQAVARTPAEWTALWREHARRQAGAEGRLRHRAPWSRCSSARARRPVTSSKSPARARTRRARCRRVARAPSGTRTGLGAGHHQPSAHRDDSEVRRRDPVPEGRAVRRLSSRGLDQPAGVAAVLSRVVGDRTRVPVRRTAGSRTFAFTPRSRWSCSARSRWCFSCAAAPARSCCSGVPAGLPVVPGHRQPAVAGDGDAVVVPAGESLAG